MKKLLFYITLIIIISVSNSFSGDAVIGDLKIEHAWTRVPPRTATNTSGYLTIHNYGTKSDILISGTSLSADKLEIHTMTLTDGIMKMRPLKNGIPIPANSTIELSPGGLHLMLSNLLEPLTEGQYIPVTLNFKHAGKVTVNLDIAGIGATEIPLTHSHGN